MLNSRIAHIATVLLAMFAASGLQAQDAPLSVIDWLKRHPDKPPLTSAVLPQQFETPVSPNALPPEVTTQPLGNDVQRLIGLVPAAITGLPETLWSGSTPDGLSAQLADLPIFQLPAAQALLYTLLLTEATGPGRDGQNEDQLTLARVQALVRMGSPEPALALLEQASVTRDKAHFAAYMDAALLTGQEDAACAVLISNPHLAPSLGHRIFCAARDGDWPTAALLFDTGNMLGEMPEPQARALERFLHPDTYDELPPLRRPAQMTPLLFRVHEAIGEPFTTGALPRPYAVADLRDLAGWKTQLEAAERLAAVGALPANRLLGLYTARKPAASGGVWERARAVQQFETALRTRSSGAISKTLPIAWDAMQNIGLEIIFAELFADALLRYDLQGRANELAQTMVLLSPDYRRSAALSEPSSLLLALAKGQTEDVVTSDIRAQALLNGFDVNNARRDLSDMARNGRMGEAILRALVLLDAGAAGDPVALTQALASLRTFGLEDTVRRAALQILLLERYS